MPRTAQDAAKILQRNGIPIERNGEDDWFAHCHGSMSDAEVVALAEKMQPKTEGVVSRIIRVITRRH